MASFPFVARVLVSGAVSIRLVLLRLVAAVKRLPKVVGEGPVGRGAARCGDARIVEEAKVVRHFEHGVSA